MVGEDAARPDLEQPGGVAWLRRPQGDAVFGKLEVEIRELHGRG
jgi:hypothetical protein